MTIRQTTEFMDRIKQHYQEFVIDDYKIEEWHKELKDYCYEDVNARLDEHLRSSQYGETIPKVYFLTKHLMKEQDKGKLDNSKVRCEICHRIVPFLQYNEHYCKCSSIEYLNIQAKKYFNKEIDKEKYKNMSKEDFENKYYSILEVVMNKTNDKEEKERIKSILLGKFE